MNIDIKKCKIQKGVHTLRLPCRQKKWMSVNYGGKQTATLKLYMKIRTKYIVGYLLHHRLTLWGQIVSSRHHTTTTRRFLNWSNSVSRTELRMRWCVYCSFFRKVRKQQGRRQQRQFWNLKRLLRESFSGTNKCKLSLQKVKIKWDWLQNLVPF